MGSRLSHPRGPDGLSEASPNRFPSRRSAFNTRQVVAPVAAFSMACILFVYARTSIRVAKANAAAHRQRDTSDGRGLDLLSESRRRHGAGERVEQSGGTVAQLARGAREQLLGGSEEQQKQASTSGGRQDGVKKAGAGAEEEARLRAAMGRRRDGS